MGILRRFVGMASLGAVLVSGGLALAEVPTPSAHAPAGSVVPLAGPVTFGDAPVSDAPRLVQSKTDFSQGQVSGVMEIRFSSFISKSVSGDKVTLSVQGEDFSMDSPGMPTPPADQIRAAIRKVTATAVVDRSSGATDVSVSGGVGPTAASVEKFARVLAKGLFGGRTVTQGEEVIHYDTEDLGTAENTGLTVEVQGRVAGEASGSGRNFVVVSGEGPAKAQGQKIGGVSFITYVDKATGLPAWTRTTLKMTVPDAQNPMSMDMVQVDEVMILE